MHITRRRTALAAGLVVATTAALTGCASGASDSGSTAAPTAAAGGVDLSGSCPATVTIQTDWYPEAEHGHLYQLLGDDYTIDSQNKTVTGPLLSKGKATGIKVQINAGGPAIGFQSVSTQMYQDKDITMGYVGTDEAIQDSATLPTKAVFAQFDTTPFMIMWDPSTYKGVSSLKDLGSELKKSGGVVRYFKGSTYMKYFIDQGVFDEANTDSSYDGTPANFVAAQGKDAQQGFATAEPYIYENEVSAWGKPVKNLLLSTAGWEPYTSATAIRTADEDKLAPCLKKLVPVLQQAEVDYMKSPSTTNDLILKLDKSYSKSWPYTLETAAFAAKTMKSDKIVTDGSNGEVGDMTDDRVQKMIDIVTPLFDGSSTMKADVTPSDLYTNEYLDSSIGLGY